MSKFVFKRDQVGVTYGVVNAVAGQVVEIADEFAADSVATGLLAPYEDAPEDAPAEDSDEDAPPVEGEPESAPKRRGRPRKEG